MKISNSVQSALGVFFGLVVIGALYAVFNPRSATTDVETARIRGTSSTVSSEAISTGVYNVDKDYREGGASQVQRVAMLCNPNAEFNGWERGDYCVAYATAAEELLRRLGHGMIDLNYDLGVQYKEVAGLASFAGIKFNPTQRVKEVQAITPTFYREAFSNHQ